MISSNATLFFGYLVPEVWAKDKELIQRMDDDDNPSIELAKHGDDDNPQYYIHVVRLTTTAWRGYPKKLELQHMLGYNADDCQSLTEFIEANGISFPDEPPQWYLVDWKK
jgi:hypothetical protein